MENWLPNPRCEQFPKGLGGLKEPNLPAVFWAQGEKQLLSLHMGGIAHTRHSSCFLGLSAGCYGNNL